MVLPGYEWCLPCVENVDSDYRNLQEKFAGQMVVKKLLYQSGLILSMTFAEFAPRWCSLAKVVWLDADYYAFAGRAWFNRTGCLRTGFRGS